MKNKIDTKYLKQLISQNKTEIVFTELKAAATSLSDTRLENQVTLMESRWIKLKQDKVKGVLSKEDQTVATSVIHDVLIDLLDNLNRPVVNPATTIPAAQTTESPQGMSWKKILTILVTTIGVMAGIAEISGYSIRDWWEPKPPVLAEEVPTHTPTDTIPPEEAVAEVVPPPPVQRPTPAPATETSEVKPIIEVPVQKTKLTVQIKTQKGTQDLNFKESEEVQLYFKVTRPCKLRTIYRLADGMLVLLDNDRIVNTPETNKWVQLSDGFEVAAPFGVEELYIFAQEKDFPELITEEKDGYTLIKDGLPSALSKTRGLKKKQVFAEDKLKITTQQKN